MFNIAKQALAELDEDNEREWEEMLKVGEEKKHLEKRIRKWKKAARNQGVVIEELTDEEHSVKNVVGTDTDEVAENNKALVARPKPPQQP